MSTENVPVRYPEPGETLRLWPLVAKVSWYRIHQNGPGRVLPCTGRGCIMGCSEIYRLREWWEGYLLCCLAQRPLSLHVARFSVGLYDRCWDFSAPATDLRNKELVYERLGRRGAPSCTLKVQESLDDGRAALEGQTTQEHLWRWWPLPEGDPDYRAAVYALGDGRAAPGGDRPSGRISVQTGRKEHNQ